MASSTAKGVPFPEETDANDVPADLEALADWIDAHPGVTPLTTAARDALTGAELWAGRLIVNVTTGQLERYDADAVAWRAATITDHGALTGLLDDDHPQYLTTTRHDTTARHGSTVVDHGSIGGLADDDHPQYLKKTGGQLTAYRETVVATGTAGAVTLDLSAANVFRLAPTGAVTIAVTGGVAGVAQAFTLVVTNSTYAITWPSGTRFPDATPPTLSGETWISGVRDSAGNLTIGTAWSGVA
jgi:hypothetical protein